ncbi:hypothetical protein BGW38_004554 [Lunasporangiospora selenospora]|uniref:Uncharacterized protein n=1 Tax=Lunasporangiospora selenospora TaxID=979761 RepID=A0A9P6FR58_9FUNG|nr:hypothetical protein BGW38_004554 [Lunasporangiospora selenospora]
MQQLYRSSMSINHSQQQNSVRRRPAKAVAFGLWAAAVCSLPTAHSVPFPQAPSPDPAPAPESPSPPPAEPVPPPTFEPIAAPAPGDTTINTGPGTKPTGTAGPKPSGGTTSGSTKTNTPILPTNTLTSANTLPTTATTPNLNPIITVSRPTTTTTSSSSTSSKSTIVATRAIPTESPYGQVIGPDKNGNLMLTVSLVVVFAVLAGMGLVVFCLFKRRSAKRRMHVFGGKGSGSDSPLASTSGLGEMLAAASVKEGGAGGSGDSTNGDPRRNSGTIGTVASDMDLRRTMLQEMSERHHSALLSRRSSTLSIGGPPLQNASTPSGTPHSAPLQMLSPTMMAARPHSMGGAYSLDPNGSGTSLNNYQNMNRSSQYEEYYGGSSLGPANPPFLYNGSSRPGSVNYTGSNEQLLMRPSSVTLSRRSSLSPGVCPQTPEMQSLPTRSKTISVGYPTAPQPHYAHSTTMPSPLAGPVSTAGYQRGSFVVSSSENLMASSSSSSGSPDRHQSGVLNSSNSIRSDGSSGEEDSLRPQPRQHSNLVIPPSITTRPRSSVGLTNSMYGQPSMGSGYYQPPMPQPQQQYQHYPANGSGTAYYSQPLPYVDNASYSGQQQQQSSSSSSDSGKGTSAGTEKNTGSATEK